MMEAARLIVIRAGATPGLQWEIERVIALNRPRDTMLLVPHSQDAYTAFVAITRTTFPFPLPEWTAFADTPSNANVAGVVRFAADWHPQALAVRLPSWSLSPLKRGLTRLLDHQDDLKAAAVVQCAGKQERVIVRILHNHDFSHAIGHNVTSQTKSFEVFIRHKRRYPQINCCQAAKFAARPS